MGKQPYIPLYVGDYLKDTRVLPLSVRGAWVDLILFMWESPTRGEISGTIEEVSRLMSCDPKEAEFALLLLKQKKTADIDLLPDGVWRIISRRMKKDAEISKLRSEAGKNGATVKFAKAKGQAKQKQNTEYDNDNVIDNEINNKKEYDFSKPDIGGDELVFPIDTKPARELWAKWKEYRWREHGERYGMMGEQADLKRFNNKTYPQMEQSILAAIAGKWKNLYPESNKTNSNGTRVNSKAEQSATTAEYLKQHYSAKAQQ